MTTQDTNLPDTTSPETSDPHQDAPARIGGWLLLLGLSIVIAPINAALSLLGVWQDVHVSGVYAQLTDPANPDYHPIWPVVLWGELAFHVVMIPALLLLAVLFFRRHRWVPQLYLGIYLVAALFIAVDLAAVKYLVPGGLFLDDAMMKNLFGVAVPLGLWAPYLFLSHRAAETFIR